VEIIEEKIVCKDYLDTYSIEIIGEREKGRSWITLYVDDGDNIVMAKLSVKEALELVEKIIKVVRKLESPS